MPADYTQIIDLRDKGYFVAMVDGANCLNLRSSIAEIAKAFKFPDYYGQNLDAFDECINDLEWLPESNYALVIQNSKLFMTNDSADNRSYLTKFLIDVTTDWAGVTNFKIDDPLRRKANFRVIYL